MKVVLHDNRTHRYYLGARKWGKSVATAYNFRSSLAAIDFCLEKQLREVDIILCFPQPKYNIRLHPFAADGQKRTTNGRKGRKPTSRIGYLRSNPDPKSG